MGTRPTCSVCGAGFQPARCSGVGSVRAWRVRHPPRTPRQAVGFMTGSQAEDQEQEAEGEQNKP